MPKRQYCSDEDEIQPIKKQLNTDLIARSIRSLSAERALQLLYEGASKLEKHKTPESHKSCNNCVECLSRKACNYCNSTICDQCSNSCYKCKAEFCRNCYFPTYEETEAICYSCY